MSKASSAVLLFNTSVQLVHFMILLILFISVSPSLRVVYHSGSHFDTHRLAISVISMKWSLVLSTTIPDLIYSRTVVLTMILSIRVALLVVMRVGLVMVGKVLAARLISRKRCVSE